jgi:GNAT superfamily N-acetyltransferase
MLENNGIVYEIFQEKDLDNTIACIVDFFPTSETLCKALGITKDEYYPLAEMICRKAVKDGLSHIAKDSSTGEVTGFRISEDFNPESNEETNLIFERVVKFHPILGLLAQLEHQYMSIQSIEPCPTLHYLMVGVKESYRNHNIAKNMMLENQKLAKTRGFKKVIGEFTGIISQHNAFKLGFKEVIAIYYRDYEYQGSRIFSHIDSPPKCILMEKIL